MAKGPIKRPFFPRNAARLTLLSATVAVAALAVAVGLHVGAGWTRVASPGPLAGAHASIEARCVQCHEPRRGAVDLRCERCHDPIDSRRFSPAAHVLATTDDAGKAAHAAAMPCATCHVDHRGRDRDLLAVDDRPCATCHQFGTFQAHPEFAIVRAAAPPNVGLEFSHAGHLKTLAQTGGERCETCHRPTGDQRSFEPISFDKHCARCHVKDGGLTIDGKTPAESGAVVADLLKPLAAPRAVLEAPDSRGRQKITNMPHADPWIIERVARLTAVLDPTGANLSRRMARVQAAIDAARAASGGILAGMAPDDLARWADALRTDIAAIDRQQAAAPGQLPAASAAALQELAGVVSAIDPSLPASVNGVATAAPPAPAPASADQARQAFDARRSEIEALVAAVSQRGTPDAQRAAADLQKRLQALTPPSGAPAPAAATDAGLVDRLRGLESAIRVVEAQSGAMAAEDLRRSLDLARQQITASSDARALAARQAEIARLLDAIEPRADAVLKRRIADLRAALAALAIGDMGTDALAARRLDKTHLLDRVNLAIALKDETAGPTPSTVREEMAAAVSHETALEARYAALARPATTLPALATDRVEAKKALLSLLSACTTCHRLNLDETGLAPVRADLRQLTAADFSHKAHVGQEKCETCHTNVDASTSGADAMLPGVKTCQACHTPGQAGATCASCHTYHAQTPGVIGALLR